MKAIRRNSNIGVLSFLRSAVQAAGVLSESRARVCFRPQATHGCVLQRDGSSTLHGKTMRYSVAIGAKAKKVTEPCDVAVVHVLHRCPCVMDLDARLSRFSKDENRVHTASLTAQPSMLALECRLFGLR